MDVSTVEVEKALRGPYSKIVVEQSDGTYFARILEFPGCIAQGKSENETLEALNRSARRWVASMLKQGNKIPRAQAGNSFSGRVLVRFPKELHQEAALQSVLEETSLNQLIVAAVSDYVASNRPRANALLQASTINFVGLGSGTDVALRASSIASIAVIGEIKPRRISNG